MGDAEESGESRGHEEGGEVAQGAHGDVEEVKGGRYVHRVQWTAASRE